MYNTTPKMERGLAEYIYLVGQETSRLRSILRGVSKAASQVALPRPCQPSYVGANNTDFIRQGSSPMTARDLRSAIQRYVQLHISFGS